MRRRAYRNTGPVGRFVEPTRGSWSFVGLLYFDLQARAEAGNG